MKIHKSSKGKCLCQNIDDMQECLKYEPWDSNYQPELCIWLCKWNGVTCLCDYTIQSDIDKWADEVKRHIAKLREKYDDNLEIGKQQEKQYAKYYDEIYQQSLDFLNEE